MPENQQWDSELRKLSTEVAKVSSNQVSLCKLIETDHKVATELFEEHCKQDQRNFDKIDEVLSNGRKEFKSIEEKITQQRVKIAQVVAVAIVVATIVGWIASAYINKNL